MAGRESRWADIEATAPLPYAAGAVSVEVTVDALVDLVSDFTLHVHDRRLPAFRRHPVVDHHDELLPPLLPVTHC